MILPFPVSKIIILSHISRYECFERETNTTQDQHLIAVCGNIRGGTAIRVLNQIYGVTDTLSLI